MTSSTKSQPDPMSICAGGSRMETSGISEFRKQKLEHNAQKNWDRFYLRNSTAFFKNRHWPRNEFVELLPELVSGEAKVLLECGCGVGNLAFPLLEYFPDLFVYACDFSPRAIEYVKSNEFYRENRVVAFTTDLTRDALSSSIPIASVDVCTLVFVLSSIDPEKVLKSTGSVFIRDYAQGDYAQQRFGDHQKLEENFYVRQDGTRSYFFTKGRPTGAVLYNIVHVYRSTVESIREQRLLRSVDYLSSQGNGESEGQHLCSKAFHPSQIQESSIASLNFKFSIHDLLGSKSHKNVSSTTSPLLRLYYTSKAFLFLMCFGNEAFFWALYVAHFDPGPIIPLLEVRCMTALAFLSFPIALVKSGISVVHLITAAKSIARIDAKPVR
ncbi:hypothetical protein M513_11707 [Trichuris suis]|uniref:Methyltransferase type 12 domain-containing protein n=1 Tax=Trichuris suis TaxID=68888 RepID=A0A085LR00_9BILA|nr:hypothetical protein M513_11707 [Trichuris suis]